MNQIINLMKLDLITVMGKSLKIYLLIFAAVSVVGYFSIPLLPVYIVLFAGFAFQPIFSVAERSGYNKLYGILPIKYKDVIIARFIICTLFLIFAAVIGIIDCKLLYEFCASQNYSEEYIHFYQIVDLMVKDGFPISLFVSIVFCFGALMTAFEFAILFIFGASKELPASIAGALCIYGLLALIIVVLNKCFDIQMQDVFEFFAEMLADHIWVLYLMCFAIGIAAMILAAVISIACTKKREL